MDIIDPIKARHLLNQIKAIKSYATCVEGELESFLGGVGTAQKGIDDEKLKKQGIDVDGIRAKARKQFSK